MFNIKKAALGLKAKPAQVGDFRFVETKQEKIKTSSFPEKTSKVDSITIKKNEDYDKLPF